MNQYPSTAEKADEQPNDNYNLWTEAMKDVPFRGDQPSESSTNGILPVEEILRNEIIDPFAEADTAAEVELARPRDSVSETIRKLNSREMERSGETVARPRAEIICDHDHIEGQRIDVINKRDRGVTEFRFKLRAPTAEMNEITTMLASAGEDAEFFTPSGTLLRRGHITYEGADNDQSYILCDASILERNGVKVSIADPKSRTSQNWKINAGGDNNQLIRTAIGLIDVEIPSEVAPEEAEQLLKDVLEKDLGIPDALGEVSEQSEREYKQARFKWQHALDGDELTAEQATQAERLERAEVFPGYTTLIEKGKHKEYLAKYGEDVRAIHHLRTGSASSIYRMLTQGLMSTTERFSRGIIRNGLSSAVDMDVGGADSAFTRIADKSRIEKMYDTVVIFKPELFDRTDWYSYDQDNYGSTNEESFAKRLSPDEIFQKTTDPDSPYQSCNEQMFRTGIGADYIESIQVNAAMHGIIVNQLREMGIEQVDGKPIEEFVTPRRVTKHNKEEQ